MFFYICFSHSLPHKNVFVHTLLKNFCKISKFFWQFAYFPLPSAPIFCPTVKNQQNLSPDNTKKAPPSGDFCTLPSLAPPPRLFSGNGDLYLRSHMQGNCRPLAPLCKGSCQRQLTEGLYEEVFVAFLLHTKQKQRVLAENFNGETTACARSVAPPYRASLFVPMGQSSLPFLLGTPRRVRAKRA